MGRELYGDSRTSALGELNRDQMARTQDVRRVFISLLYSRIRAFNLPASNAYISQGLSGFPIFRYNQYSYSDGKIMALSLFNTLTLKVEPFSPMDGETVRMYNCGPTVYDFAHIGNFRTFIAIDILRRFLLQSGYKLKHVMNITDVDDRIIANSAKLGISVREYTSKYETLFLEDSAFLNIHRPEFIARATEHMTEMADLIDGLAQKDVAYKTDDGSYYYRIAKFPEYGKLSHKDLAHIEDGARVDSDRFDKEEARDFALWKAPKPGEAFWETKIGAGRPGWHIECSAMAMKYLGQSFDLHAGGEDLIFPHHENEIAQSEAFTGKRFSHFWMHVRFLLIEADKMSKSQGNFHTLRDLMLLGHKPSSIRFLLSSVPYRKQLNFTFGGLTQAANSVERLRNFKLRVAAGLNGKDGGVKGNDGHPTLPEGRVGETASLKSLAEETSKRMTAVMDNDLNTAEALGAMFEMVREANAAMDAGNWQPATDQQPLLAAIQQFDDIFAIIEDTDAEKMRAVVEWARANGQQEKISAPALEFATSAALADADIEALVAQNTAARKAKDFKAADAIRDQLLAQGVILENTKEGVRWRRK